MMVSNVRVYVEIDGRPVHAGHLYTHRRRRTESASFGYAETYRADPDAYQLDPGLPLQSGTQHGLTRRAIEEMAPAFEHDQSRLARELTAA
jgi:hypothetical protein